MEYLSKYINEMQNQIVTQPHISVEQIAVNIRNLIPGADRLFELTDYVKGGNKTFSARILIREGLGDGRFVRISDKTNAGMREFSIER